MVTDAPSFKKGDLFILLSQSSLTNVTSTDRNVFEHKPPTTKLGSLGNEAVSRLFLIAVVAACYTHSPKSNVGHVASRPEGYLSFYYPSNQLSSRPVNRIDLSRIQMFCPYRQGLRGKPTRR